jgi:hypothetical protein
METQAFRVLEYRRCGTMLRSGNASNRAGETMPTDLA